MQRYTSGGSLSVDDVRNELYALLGEMEDVANQHVSSWTESREGHSLPCPVCDRLKAERNGVKRAIRVFGGRPQNWW